MNQYLYQLKKSMKLISENPRTIFLGQSVSYSGSSIYASLDHIKKNKIELPVFEDTQMGMSIGLAMAGYLPITCYPRMDFLILASNQMINSLDKISEMSKEDFNPKIIIRTCVGAKKPLNAGPQHTGNYYNYFKKVLKNINVVNLNSSNIIFKEYKKAIHPKNKKSTLFVEYQQKYHD